MTFSNTYKQHLNILIPYYRIRNLKISKDVQWKQANFYKDALHIPVCSSSVYCSLEKQKACVRDEVYELAAKKLGNAYGNPESGMRKSIQLRRNYSRLCSTGNDDGVVWI